MSRYWSSIVHQLIPYVAGEQPAVANLVKLNTNENPYGPSPHVIAAIKADIGDTLRLYPDPSAFRLRATIANCYGIDADQVFVGNGSDEVLAHTFQALLKHDDPLLFPDITYSFYPTYCKLYGIEFREVPVGEAMQIHIADYFRPCGAIILANPNAPTGRALRRDEIKSLVASHPDQVVVIDEAYVDFGGETAIPLVSEHSNLLVIQTLSKSRSMAGLRVGFAVGQRPLVEALERVKNSFNSYPLGRLAIAGAIAAFEDQDWFERHRDRVIASRERLKDALQNLGFDVVPSSANFLFVRHPRISGSALAVQLRARGILVRHFAKPRIEDYLRISVGTDTDCDRLIVALRDPT
jgi:histidinol-phosphate aminotransferase